MYIEFDGIAHFYLQICDSSMIISKYLPVDGHPFVIRSNAAELEWSQSY